jgi:hypothetical protein
MTDYYGLTTGALENDCLRVEYLVEGGLRLVRLCLKSSTCQENLLAETPEIGWPTPHGTYFLRGGHRLWHAPEAAGRSSIPDAAGLEVVELTDGVRLCQPPEPVSGIRKSLEVHIPPDRPALRLRHILTNEGVWPVELAPWAITQLALGGVAILPQPAGPLDPHGLQPNRSLVLWPYTRSADSRLELHDDFWLVHGRPKLPPCKIGYLNRRGWAGYLWKQILLVKRFWPLPEQQHADWGCNVETYCNDVCLELETLAPLSRLAPGQSAVHIEQWEFHAGADVPATHEGVQHLVSRLPPQWLEPARGAG